MYRLVCGNCLHEAHIGMVSISSIMDKEDVLQSNNDMALCVKTQQKVNELLEKTRKELRKIYGEKIFEKYKHTWLTDTYPCGCPNKEQKLLENS